MKTQLMITGVLVLGACSVAYAKLDLPSPRTPDALLNLDIESQPVDTAINVWAEQTGYQVLLPVGRATSTSVVPAVKGTYTSEAALELILADTDLTHEFVNTRTVAITPKETSKGADKDSGHEKLEEVVVTAQKRSELAQDVPSAISVLSGSKLIAEGVVQLSDYAKQIPGLNLIGASGPGKGQAVLRGITSGGDRGSVVGLYLDDVPFTPSSVRVNSVGLSFDPDLADIEHIEVLKGPQSTLYGASTLGGLIKFVTRQPGLKEFEGMVRSEGSQVDGGGGGFGIRGSVNVPIVEERVGLRASAFYREAPGFVDNRAAGVENINDHTAKGARLSLRVKLTDTLENTLSGLVQNIDADGPNQVFLTPGTLSPSLGGLAYSSAISQPDKIEYRSISNATALDLGFATLTNIASYVGFSDELTVDFSALGPAFGASGITYAGHPDSKRTSDEIRLASASDTLEWLLGAFYTRERDSNPINMRGTDATGATLPSSSPSYNIYTYSSSARYTEWATFGDLTYHLSDKLEATVGTRYSSNRQSFDVNAIGRLTGNQPVVQSQPSRDSAQNYLATLSYKPVSTLTLYARAASAYRPGGANALNSIQIAAGVPLTYGPDTLWNYEAGIKGTAWDQRISYTVDAFHMRWTDVQLQVLINNFSAVTNAASAKSNGAEASLRFVPWKGLDVGLNAVYTNARITSDVPSAGFVNGAHLPYSPQFSGAAIVDYRFPTRTGISPSTGLTYAHRGSQNTVVSNGISYTIPSYDTLDMRAGLDWSRYRLMVRVDNVTDEYGLSNATRSTALGSPIAGAVIKPRTYGLSLEASF